MSEYFVTKRTKCEKCENGIVQHPAWTAFFEKFPPGQWPELEVERAYWLEWNFRKGPPPEEVPCGYCEGAGYTECEIGLIEALTELNVSLNFIY